MKLDELHRHLQKAVLHTTSFGYSLNISTTSTYRNFYLLQLKPYKKPYCHVQRPLEKLRPLLDYILLPDNSILVGATEDFSDMKKAALELMMKRLVDKQKESLKYHEDLLQTTQFYQTATPFTSIYPELFI